MLDGQRNNYIVAVAFDGKRAGVAYADISTGEFAATEIAADSPEEALAAATGSCSGSARPRSCSLPRGDGRRRGTAGAGCLPTSPVSRTEAWRWRPDRAAEALRGTSTSNRSTASACRASRSPSRPPAALLAYLADTQRSGSHQIAALRPTRRWLHDARRPDPAQPGADRELARREAARPDRRPR